MSDGDRYAGALRAAPQDEPGLDKIQLLRISKIQGAIMSSTAPELPDQPVDAVETVVSFMPLVLPLAGAVLMFLLAFIAVSMA